MLYQGQAMLRALVQDFCSTGYGVLTTWDSTIRGDHFLPGQAVVRHVKGLQTLQDAWRDAAQHCHRALVIAPETNLMLVHVCQQVRDQGLQLVQSDLDFMRLVSDKHATAAWLTDAGFRTTQGSVWMGKPTSVPEFPVVVKPVTGAGCEDTYVIRSRSAWDALPWKDQSYRVEQWVPGTPASVAMLIGPKQTLVLAPCLQHLDDEYRLRYLGGTVLTSDTRAPRIRELAQRVAPLLAPRGARGYLGIDLVLGSAEDGSQDTLVEINPRLTTSYVGLRSASKHNLAQAMLRNFAGEPTVVEFRSRCIRFTADGAIVQV